MGVQQYEQYYSTMRHVISILLLSICLWASGQVMGKFPHSRSTGEPPEPPPPSGYTNLVGYWALTGGVLTDSAGTDNMVATGAVNRGDTAYYFDGVGDFLSWTGTVNTEATYLFEVWPLTYAAYDLMGGATGGQEIALYCPSTNLRPRALIGGGSGASVATASLLVDQWNYLSVSFSDSGDSIVYGVNGVYQTVTDWDETTSAVTNTIGTGTVGSDFYGYIKNIWKFSDVKSESYKTAMQGRYYSEGDPE